jgi:hypothetical protein
MGPELVLELLAVARPKLGLRLAVDVGLMAARLAAARAVVVDVAVLHALAA